MRRISAHYIFDGTQFLKYATLLLNGNKLYSITPCKTQFIEQANTEFYSGILYACNENTSKNIPSILNNTPLLHLLRNTKPCGIMEKAIILLIQNIDFETFSCTENTTISIL